MIKLMHGGRLDAAIEKYGGERKDWIDLSTGINPNGYPAHKIDIPSDIWRDLPDDGLLNDVKQAANAYYEAPEGVEPVIGAGSQSFIQILPRLFKPQSVAIIGYTYQEHGLRWQQAGHDVLVADGLESAAASARIVILVNPNNPDGDAIDPDAFVNYAARLGAKGGALIVDEAFGDVASDFSAMDYAGSQGLIILRSIGKFFGLAGIRLGFAYCDSQRREQLENALGIWPVSAPSLYIGASALNDTTWIKRAHKTIEARSAGLDQVLDDADLEIIGGTMLYTLIRYSRAEKLVKYLAQNHILVRHFTGRKEWIRFGLPANVNQTKRLAKVLANFSSLDNLGS